MTELLVGIVGSVLIVLASITALVLVVAGIGGLIVGAHVFIQGLRDEEVVVDIGEAQLREDRLRNTSATHV